MILNMPLCFTELGAVSNIVFMFMMIIQAMKDSFMHFMLCKRHKQKNG